MPLPSLSIEELVLRCSSSGDLDAWDEFVRRLHRLIAKVVYRVARRMGDCKTETVDDLIQETYLKLCADNYRILREFDHRHEGAFLGFVQVIAANVTRDHFRSAYVKNSALSQSEIPNEEAFRQTPEQAGRGSGAIEREVLIREIANHLDLCTSGPDQDRNRKIFWLYYRTGLSASEIAALPGIRLNTKGIESLVLRLKRELRSRLATSGSAAPHPSHESGEGILPAESF